VGRRARRNVAGSVAAWWKSSRRDNGPWSGLISSEKFHPGLRHSSLVDTLDELFFRLFVRTGFRHEDGFNNDGTPEVAVAMSNIRFSSSPRPGRVFISKNRYAMFVRRKSSVVQYDKHTGDTKKHNVNVCVCVCVCVIRSREK